MDERQRLALVGIVDGLEQQVILGSVVAKRDPYKEEDLSRAIAKANAVLEKLKPAVIDAIADPTDKNAQNYLEDIMQDTRQANNDLVEAAQAKDVFDRILANIDATDREMRQLDETLRKGDRGTALAIAADIRARQQKQAQLLKKAATQTGPKTGAALNEHGLHIAKIGSTLANAAEGRAANPKGGCSFPTPSFFSSSFILCVIDVPSATAYNRGANKLKTTNQEIRDLIEKWRSGKSEEEDKPQKQDDWSAGQGGLQSAANALRKRTRELQVDGTPKGEIKLGLLCLLTTFFCKVCCLPRLKRLRI